MTGFIVLMASFMASVALSIDVMLPALKVIGESLGVEDINHTQLIIVSVFVGSALGQLVCGPLSDALGRKKILYAGFALYALGSLVCMFAPTLPVMLAGRVLQGLGVSGPYVSALAIIRDKYRGTEMARILSLVLMIFIIVPCIAPMLGQVMLFFFDWHAIFALLFIVAVGLGIWTHFNLEETLPPEKRLPFHAASIARGFHEAVTTRVTFCYMVAMGLIFGSFIGYLNSTRQIFQDLFGTGTWFSFYFGALALVFGGASMLNSRIVAAVGMRALCRRAAFAVMLASLLFIFHALGDTPSLWLFLSYAGVVYFAMGLMFGNLNAIALEPMGHIAGIASAVTGAVSSIIAISAGTLIGQMYDGTLVPVTAGFLLLSLLCLIFILLGGSEAAQEATA